MSGMTAQPAKRVSHTDIGGDLGGRVASRLSARGVEVTDGSAGAEILFLVPVRERADRVAVHRPTT